MTWTFSPFYESMCLRDCSVDSPRCLRAIASAAGDLVGIILDSGADSSVLPPEFFNAGRSVRDEEGSCSFVDAQGQPIGVHDLKCVLERQFFVRSL